MRWPDLLRFIVFGQGAVVFCLSAIIIVRYILLLKASPSGGGRALPIHIFMVSTSYMLATIFICLELWFRIGEALSYRTPLALITFALGDVSLISMLTHLIIQRKLLDRLRAAIEKRLAPGPG